MRLLNFWLLKAKEKTLLKIVDWAHKNKKRVEFLTKQDIAEALKAQKNLDIPNAD
jgi:hypothetical protein